MCPVPVQGGLGSNSNRPRVYSSYSSRIWGSAGWALWLVNTPQTDIAGRVWNGNGPIRGYQDSQSLAKILAIAPEAPLVFDVLYKNHDEGYLDAQSLQEILAQSTG